MGVNLQVDAVPHEIDGHYIKSARSALKLMPRKVIDRHMRDFALLPGGHRGRAAAIRVALARLYLDEDGRLAVSGDDVNFSKPGPVAPRKNCVPAALQLGAREIFAQSSQRLPGITAHAR